MKLTVECLWLDFVQSRISLDLKYHACKIVAENTDGSYAVEYEDGTKGGRVVVWNIRPAPQKNFLSKVIAGCTGGAS